MMTLINFNGRAVYSRNFDEVEGWAEIPIIMACDGAQYCPLTLSGNPIFTLVEGEVKTRSWGVSKEYKDWLFWLTIAVGWHLFFYVFISGKSGIVYD